MKSIRVNLGCYSYPIVTGFDMMAKLPDCLKKAGCGPDAVVVTNPLINQLHGNSLAKILKKSGFTVKIFEVKDAESSKSIKVAVDLIQKIVTYGKDRKVFVIAFGGGVVGDLAGFVAAVTKRGLPFVQIPTTLLAQIDSSIGGKVAVDLPAGKNLVGAFYQPRLVFADTRFLSTLTERQIRNGLAEAVKYGVIADEKLFAFMEKNFRRLLAKDPAALALVVERCAAIKARVVSKDEKETKGYRTILNFGHTVGHAIETAAGYDRYQHGEAVALGMRVVSDISRRMKLISVLEAERVQTLLSALGLPEQIENIAPQRILAAMSFDKKFQGKKNRFVLAHQVGSVVVKEAIPVSVIMSSLQQFVA